MIFSVTVPLFDFFSAAVIFIKAVSVLVLLFIDVCILLVMLFGLPLLRVSWSVPFFFWLVIFLDVTWFVPFSKFFVAVLFKVTVPLLKC